MRNNRRKEFDLRYVEVFLSNYQREDNPNKRAIIIPISRVVKMMEECEPSMTIESYEVPNLMAIHKFEFTRRDREFWFLVKEKKKGQVNDPSLDFY